MTPYEFIAKWRAAELKERSASQEHFIGLCRLLGEPTPAEADPSGETYCFERGARKDTGGDGWADGDVPVPDRPDTGHPRRRLRRRSGVNSPGSTRLIELRDRWLNPPEPCEGPAPPGGQLD